jgi:hypothetical protein
MMKIEIVSIGPDQARELLARKSRTQPPLDDAKVAAFAADMTAGRWQQPSPMMLCFFRDGVEYLVDGQHRLAAIIASGVTVPIELQSGVYDYRRKDRQP